MRWEEIRHAGGIDDHRHLPVMKKRCVGPVHGADPHAVIDYDALIVRQSESLASADPRSLQTCGGVDQPYFCIFASSIIGDI